MKEYDITVEILQLDKEKYSDYCFYDNTIATGVLFSETIRDKMHASELTKYKDQDSVLQLYFDGTIQRTALKFKLYDYSGEYLDKFKFWYDKWATDYPMTMQVEERTITNE